MAVGEGTIKAIITADDSQYKRVLKNLPATAKSSVGSAQKAVASGTKQMMSNISNAIKSAASSMKQTGLSIGRNLIAPFSSASSKIQQVISRITAKIPPGFTKAFSSVGKVVTTFASRIPAPITNAFSKVNGVISRAASKITPIFSKTFNGLGNAASKGVSLIGNKFSALGRVISSATKEATQKFTTGFSNAFSKVTTSVSNATNKIKNDFNGIIKKAGEVENHLSDISRKMAIAAGAISVGLGAAIKTAADFESQMSSVKAISGASASEMKQLGALAMKAGADTKYSSKEAAQGIEELMKAGVSTADILNGGLLGALNLATAGDLELADSAEIASTALNAFKADNLSVAEAADILAGAANASATDVTEMKFALSQVSAVASGVGLSFKDTSTMLAVFAQNGLKGSDAGTSLKTMLSRLHPQTDKAWAEFERLGLVTTNTQAAMKALKDNGIKPLGTEQDVLMEQMHDLAKSMAGPKATTGQVNKEFNKLLTNTGSIQSAFYDANGNLKDATSIADTLQYALKDLNSEQRQQALYTMFGSDAIRGATIVYKEGSKGLKDMYKEMSKVTAAEVAAEKMNNFKGAIELLGGSAETAMTAIGNAFLPNLTAIVLAVDKVVDSFNGLSPSMQKFIAYAAAGSAGVLGLGAAFTGGLAAVARYRQTIDGIATVFPKMAKVVHVMTSPLKLISVLFSGLGKAIRLVATGFRLLTAAMIANPIVAIIAAIVALVAALVWFFTQTKTGQKIVKVAWEGIKNVTKVVVDFLIKAWESTAKFFTNLWNSISSGAKTIWNGVVSIWNATVGGIKDAWSGLKGFFGGLWSGIKGGASNVWSGTTNIWNKSIDAIKSAWNGVTNFFSNLWTGISSVSTTAWKAISTAIMSVLQPFINILLSTFNGIGSGISKVWEGIKIAASGAWTLIKNVILGPVLLLIDLITGDFEGLKTDAIAIWNNIKNAASMIWLGLKTMLSGIVTALVSYVTGAFELFKTTVSTIWNGMKSASIAIWEGLKTAISNIGEAIKNSAIKSWNALKTGVSNAVKATKNAAISTWNSLKTGFINLGNNIKNGAINSWNALKNGVSNAVKNAKNTAINTWNALKQSIINASISLANGVINSWTNLKNSVINLVNNIKNGAINAWNTLKSATSRAFKAVVNFIKDPLKGINLYQVGVDIIKGLINGIGKMAGAVKDKVASIAQGIKDKIKGALDIHSPSRVMEKYGIYTGQGLLIGMASMQSAINKQALAYADTIKSQEYSANSTITADSSMISGGVSSSLDNLSSEVANTELADLNVEIVNEWNGEQVVAYVNNKNTRGKRRVNVIQGR
ncbi:phage tail tape measure protein [Listeria booriae]|uniref:phage tail tape measure protein n=1 Tax=Listeria booriae TaxID=1552123 RepID=UPI0021AB655F|nr:phage tail tape measure protein [Listeria booriae]